VDPAKVDQVSALLDTSTLSETGGKHDEQIDKGVERGKGAVQDFGR